MRNPLNKRFLRELKGELAKYIVIFVFMTAVIGLISGFLIADGSMYDTYNKSFEKYNIEDGNFELYSKADESVIDKLEKENVTIYENFYKEEIVVRHNNIKNDEDSQSTLRFYVNREEVDKVDLMEGSLPEDINEIAIDRMYAVNNDIKVQDTITVGSRILKVTGLVALSDYSSLFSDNSDLVICGTAIPTKDIGPARAVTHAESKLESNTIHTLKNLILIPMLCAYPSPKR